MKATVACIIQFNFFKESYTQSSCCFLTGEEYSDEYKDTQIS